MPVTSWSSGCPRVHACSRCIRMRPLVAALALTSVRRLAPVRVARRRRSPLASQRRFRAPSCPGRRARCRRCVAAASTSHNPHRPIFCFVHSSVHRSRAMVSPSRVAACMPLPVGCRWRLSKGSGSEGFGCDRGMVGAAIAAACSPRLAVAAADVMQWRGRLA